jgi:BirA family biotin operon repressor/biotin-[acetyl-CoA-carboxylase] ligase
VADALAARRFEPRIKWPNDVLIGDRKVAGVLAESRPPAFALVGVGINAAVDPAQWSPDLRSRARTLGLEPSEVEALFDEVVARLLIAGRAVDEGDTIALQEAWERFARIRGTPVVRGSVQGTAEGLAEDGALLVRSGEGTLRRLLE